MKNILLVPFLAALLGACGEAEAPPDAAPAAAAPQTAVQEAPDPPAYVGRWAANEGLCESGAWDFQHDGLSTAGEVSCRFDGVAALDDGYEVAATCTAQAPPESHRLRLFFGAGGETMVVQGGPFSEPPPLIRCDA